MTQPSHLDSGLGMGLLPPPFQQYFRYETTAIPQDVHAVCFELVCADHCPVHNTQGLCKLGLALVIKGGLIPQP